MIIERMSWILRHHVQANPRKVFLFGDNLLRIGLGGQAKEMRGEPNSVGVAVKRRPDIIPRAYFTDAEYEFNCDVIKEDICRAVELAATLSGIIVLPTDGIGTGLAMLPAKAPRTFNYLQTMLAGLKHL